MDYFITLFFSEITLSLYPQLIKLVNTNLETQLASRFITYSILSLIVTLFYNPYNLFFNYSLSEYIGLGSINIVHVLSSYIAFRILSSGTSYTLFYTYPIFNLIARSLFYKEKILLHHYIYIIIAIIGVYLITNKQLEEKKDTTKDYLIIGLSAGIISAITESIIYLFVKNQKRQSPFQDINRFYLFGGFISIILAIYSNTTTQDTFENKESNNSHFFEIFTINKIKIDLDKNKIITLVLFNALIGFIGYVLRFYIIPKISTLQFNSLIFIGVIFAYVWGFFLSNEQIYLENVLGSFLILTSIYLINFT
jgi:drug/metabolite transporter (DMT)-like permease